MSEAFWIVWSPSGVRPPTVRHRTFELAQEEAKRLARQDPAHEFFVLRAITRAVYDAVRIDTLDEIPF